MTTTYIDRESATKALAALDEISGDELVAALRFVLERKLSEEEGELVVDDTLPSKFRNFFNIIFEVSPEEKALPVEKVIELVDIAIAGLEDCKADEIADDPEDLDRMVEMYEEDASYYRTMRQHLVDGKLDEAIQTYGMMDTAPRGRLFGRTPIEDYHLGVFLSDHKY